METKWTWCCCGCPKCSACLGNEGPEMIWTHVKGMAAACDSHNRNLEFDYYGRYLGGCAYGIEGEDPKTQNLIGIYPDGYATFRSIGAAQPTLNFRYPDCSDGVLMAMDCVRWGDDNSAWTCCVETCDCTNAYIEVLGVGPRQILDNTEGNILDESGNPIEGIIESECGGEEPLECTDWCNQGTTPRAFRVEVQGVVDQLPLPEPPEGCSWFNGTFICDIQQEQNWPPNDTCQWWLYPSGGGSVRVEFDINHIRVQQVTPSGAFVNWELDMTGVGRPLDCRTLVDMDLVYLSTNANCDFVTTGTCKVWAIE